MRDFFFNIFFSIAMYFMPADYDSHLNKSTAPITAWYDPTFLQQELKEHPENFYIQGVIGQNSVEIRLILRF